VSCLLYPTELHCSGGHGCVLRRYTQQQRCSAPVWLQPQPLAQEAHQDLGDDGRAQWSWTLIKFFDVAGGTISACRFHADMRIREPFGTPWSRNSIWSARILRLLKMNASYRFGTYGT
jgi:hypothetical protein